MIEPLLTPTNVAKYLKLSKSKVYEMLQRRLIPYIKIGKNVRVKPSELEKWIEQNTVTCADTKHDPELFSCGGNLHTELRTSQLQLGPLTKSTPRRLAGQRP